MSRNSFAVIALIGFSVLLGCSDSKKEKAEPAEKKEVDKTAQKQTEPRVLSEVEQKLVGLWLGGASLEQQQIQTALDAETDAELRTELLSKAQHFLSTEMAMQFMADGTMEQHVEMVLAGKVEAMVGVGYWKVLDHQDNKFVVEIVEVSPEGKETTTERLYQFYEDGQRFAMPAPADDALATFNPTLVFQRIPDLEEDRTADTQGQSGEPVTR